MAFSPFTVYFMRVVSQPRGFAVEKSTCICLEIEQDKKKAEQEGIAVTTPRKPRSHEPDSDRRKIEKENITVTVDLSKLSGNRRPGTKSSVDMTLSMTGRERAEYLRWKKERKQIDEERLARHRNSTGQWKREWDAQKTDTMFSEDSAAAGEATPEAGSRREDSKRPPKVPTFGNFLGHGKSREERRSCRGRGKGRGQGKSYSMHDNRWEKEKEEEKPREEHPKALSEKKELKSSSSHAPSTPSPKQQRTSGPKVDIPSPQESLSTPETLSPYIPLEDHQPVLDWGEEMEKNYGW
ncbi:coiled-coil domain-containing protein 9-like isoform X3 [Brachyhypopomus gauderio]|uniref:coiled-coil domain-containing protein 9-like isoform X3 n=1 Tax=Brachyhypopomus gauderio TaxID=698409 RepID=UPI0040414569